MLKIAALLPRRPHLHADERMFAVMVDADAPRSAGGPVVIYAAPVG
jgi:hypothetical protein